MLLFEMHFLSLCHPVVPVIGSGIFLRSTVYLLMATQNIQLKGFGDDQTNNTITDGGSTAPLYC